MQTLDPQPSSPPPLVRHAMKLHRAIIEWGNGDEPCPTGAGNVLNAYDVARHYALEHLPPVPRKEGE